MITQNLKKLEKARARLVKLEQDLAESRAAELSALPGQYGYDSVNAFLHAVRLSAKGWGRHGRKAGVDVSTRERRRRSRITEKTREQVKKLVEAGKTATVIVKSLGISLPSVQNIKRALGLVRKRRK
jgi:hypothetical protein